MKTKIVACKNILSHVQNTLKNLHMSQENFNHKLAQGMT
jgi:hypothetical protein